MSAIAWSDVTGMFPTDAILGAVPVPAQTNILAFVNTNLSSSFFGGDGPKLTLARIYLAAHFAIIGSLHGSSGTIAGPLIGESLGDASKTYATTFAVRMTSHGTTGYGQLFDALVASSPNRIGVTT